MRRCWSGGIPKRAQKSQHVLTSQRRRRRRRRPLTFFILNFLLDIVNGVRGFNLKGDGLPCQSLDKNLHCVSLN